jgi:nucleotide-binding universal stress UspA family protein
MFQSCLICTDFTDGLYRLVNFVPDLARCGLKKIIFFHSVPLWEEGEVPRIDEEKITEAKQRFSVALTNVPQDVEVKIEVPCGKPLDTIPRLLKQESIDVILTGTPIRSLLQERFFGSTSVGLAKLATQPLAIVRPQLITTYTKEELALRCQHLWRSLLIPYNDSATARYLIQQLKTYAQNCNPSLLPECILVAVVGDSGRAAMYSEQRVKDTQAKLAEVASELAALNIKVSTEVRQGNALTEILAAASSLEISAIALATDFKNNPLQWTVRSFANDLMRSSWFPLLLFTAK